MVAMYSHFKRVVTLGPFPPESNSTGLAQIPRSSSSRTYASNVPSSVTTTTSFSARTPSRVNRISQTLPATFIAVITRPSRGGLLRPTKSGGDFQFRKGHRNQRRLPPVRTVRGRPRLDPGSRSVTSTSIDHFPKSQPTMRTPRRDLRVTRQHAGRALLPRSPAAAFHTDAPKGHAHNPLSKHRSAWQLPFDPASEIQDANLHWELPRRAAILRHCTRHPQSRLEIRIALTYVLPDPAAPSAIQTMERGTGFEPATICLEGRDSTPELPPLGHAANSLRTFWSLGPGLNR